MFVHGLAMSGSPGNACIACLAWAPWTFAEFKQCYLVLFNEHQNNINIIHAFIIYVIIHPAGTIYLSIIQVIMKILCYILYEKKRKNMISQIYKSTNV